MGLASRNFGPNGARRGNEAGGLTRGVDLGWVRVAHYFKIQFPDSESQRDSIVQPKVAPAALPWVQNNPSPQPQRGLRLFFG